MKMPKIVALKGMMGGEREATLELCSDELKAIKDWKVGETYNLQLKVRLIGLESTVEEEEEDMEEKGKKEKPSKEDYSKLDADFEIISVKEV